MLHYELRGGKPIPTSDSLELLIDTYNIRSHSIWDDPFPKLSTIPWKKKIQPSLHVNKLNLKLSPEAVIVFFCRLYLYSSRYICVFLFQAAGKGMNVAWAGFVFSFYAFVMFLMSPVCGKILPHTGAKFLFLSGVFIAGWCNILFG